MKAVAMNTPCATRNAVNNGSSGIAASSAGSEIDRSKRTHDDTAATVDPGTDERHCQARESHPEGARVDGEPPSLRD